MWVATVRNVGLQRRAGAIAVGACVLLASTGCDGRSRAVLAAYGDAASTRLELNVASCNENPTAEVVESDAEVQSFVQAVDPARLAKLRVVRIDRPRQSVINGAEAQAIFKARAAREGVNEITERIALYELSGQLYWGGFQLCRYHNSWKIYEFGSNLAGPLAFVVVGG